MKHLCIALASIAINSNSVISTYSSFHCKTDTCTQNQLIFATALFCNVLEINWFAKSNFCDQDVDYLEYNIPETFEAKKS